MMNSDPRRFCAAWIRADAVALLADHEQEAEIRERPRPAALRRAHNMEAMMPFTSQAPRPQISVSSSRDGKNGGTVSR